MMIFIIFVIFLMVLAVAATKLFLTPIAKRIENDRYRIIPSIWEKEFLKINKVILEIKTSSTGVINTTYKFKDKSCAIHRTLGGKTVTFIAINNGKNVERQQRRKKRLLQKEA